MRYLGLIAAFTLLTGIPALSQPSGAVAPVTVESLPDSPRAISFAIGDSATDMPGSSSSQPSSSQPATWAQLTLDAAALPGLGAAEASSATPCTLSDAPAFAAAESDLPPRFTAAHASCLTLGNNPLRPFVTPPAKPLTRLGKLHLALYDLTNPGNLAAVAGNAAYTVMTDAHSPYGPGFNGFRRNVQVSLAGEASTEFIGTFGVCALVHQDPRYFRMPNASPVRRLIHAVAHVAIAQSDRGRSMPNLENLVASYSASELANLYVPGIDTSVAATNERILAGVATEPIGNILAEFLPDIASHVHLHILVMQRFLNQISSGQPMSGTAFNNPTPP